MRKAVCILALAVGFCSTPAVAAPEPDGWNGEMEFSYLLKRGNTVSDSLVSKANGEFEGPDWRHTAKFEAVNTTSEDTTTGESERTAERYFASYKLDKRFGEENYLFNIVSYDKDVFSGFQYQASYALGYGRTLLDSDTQELNAEIGPGYRVRCLEPEDRYLDCENHENDGILRIAGKYVWRISESATFREEISTEIAEFATVTRAETSLTSRINNHLALRLSHLLKHNSSVPPGNKEADHEVTVSLVVGF